MRVQMLFSLDPAETVKQHISNSSVTEKYYYNFRHPKKLALANTKGFATNYNSGRKTVAYAYV